MRLVLLEQLHQLGLVFVVVIPLQASADHPLELAQAHDLMLAVLLVYAPHAA